MKQNPTTEFLSQPHPHLVELRAIRERLDILILLAPNQKVAAQMLETLESSTAEDAEQSANDVVVLYSTCPDCGAQEEIGRAVNPDPEDLDQLTYGEPVIRLCETCQKKRLIVQTVIIEDFKAKGPIRAAMIEALIEAIDANHAGLRTRLSEL